MTVRSNKLVSAFTMVEILITLAITGLLLATIAVAFNASIVNYRENEDIFRTVNNARQALTRITSQLRTADSVDPDAPSNVCSLFTADGQDITFWFDSLENTLRLHEGSAPVLPDDPVLCDNVTSMTFTKQTVIEDSQTKVKSVQISMTVENDNIQRTLSAAAVIRRNLH